MMTSDPFSLSFNQATTHYFNKDFKEAIGSLNTCLELHPTDSGSFYLRAECNYRLKNYSQSEEDIQKAIVRDPKCASAFFLRGNLFHERYKDFSKAIEDYSLAIQLNSEVFSYYLNRATCYFRVRMFEEAVEDLDRSIALQSSDRALAQRGKVRAAAKQYEKAILDYSEAILANKSHTMYYNNRAECYFHLGRHEEAMRDLERALELCPNSVTALHLKGMIFHAKKNYLEAIDCYSKAITDKGTNPIFYFNRGESYRKLKKYSECLEDYSTAIKLDSRDVDNYNNRGNVYFAMGKYQQAIDDYSSCIGIQSSFSIFYFNRGNCYFQMKKYREAVSDFGKAIELNPSYIKAYNKRGLALTFLKDFQLALIDYSNVIQNYKGENVSYLYNRGNCYYELGMYSEALQDLDRVLIQNDKYDLAYNRRGIVFYRMKNYKDAISNFTKAIDLCTTNPIYFCNRGDSYYYSKKYPEAISDFNLAISKLTDPNVLSDCYYKLGRTFYARKDHSLAIKNYSKALTFQSDNPYYLFHQGNAYIKLRDRTKAMAAYDEAIRLDPNFADAIFKRGNVYYSQKLYEKSAQEYSRCISIHSNNATYFYSRGNCYRVLERYQEALQDLETAINLNKKCYQAFNIRGLVFMLKHEYKHAMSDFLQLENKNFQYKKEFAQLLKNNVSEITQQENFMSIFYCGNAESCLLGLMTNVTSKFVSWEKNLVKFPLPNVGYSWGHVEEIKKSRIIVLILSENVFSEFSLVFFTFIAALLNKKIFLLWDKKGCSGKFPSYAQEPQILKDEKVFDAIAITYFPGFEADCWNDMEGRLDPRFEEDVSTDFFLSHRQLTGQTIAKDINLLLKFQGYKVFLDIDTTFEIHNLRLIVQNTKLFVFILSEGIFDSAYCLTEFKSAMEHKREILVIKSDSFELPQLEKLPEEWKEYADIVLAPTFEFVVQRFRASVEKIEKYYKEKLLKIGQ